MSKTKKTKKSTKPSGKEENNFYPELIKPNENKRTNELQNNEANHAWDNFDPTRPEEDYSTSFVSEESK